MNLGNPEEISIHDLARRIIAITDSPSQLIYCSLPGDDPVRRRPDIALARERLGWAPLVSLDAGLCKTVDYFCLCKSRS